MTPRERLTHLAALLDTVPSERFNLSLWVDSTQECGFAGCAVGWATHDRALKAEGLTFDDSCGAGAPTFEGLRNWPAVELFFGLEVGAADHLFGPWNYPGPRTPAAVAARIREHLAKGDQP